jgi:hypothetical protein
MISPPPYLPTTGGYLSFPAISTQNNPGSQAPPPAMGNQPNAYIPPVSQFAKYGAGLGLLIGSISSLIGGFFTNTVNSPRIKTEVMPASALGISIASALYAPIAGMVTWALGGSLLGFLANQFFKVKTPQQP